jgi:TolB protein
VVDVASGVELRLTDDSAADVAPVWSPDGRRIAFLSDRGGAWAVYVLDIASDQVRKVIATGDMYPEPASERLSWAP